MFAKMQGMGDVFIISHLSRKNEDFIHPPLHKFVLPQFLRRSMLAQWACLCVLCFGQKSFFKYKIKGDEKKLKFSLMIYRFFNSNVFVYDVIFMLNYFSPFMLNCPYM